MKLNTQILMILFAILILSGSLACTNNEDTPIVPPQPDLSSQVELSSDGSQVWGAYHMKFDPATEEITYVENRQLAKHFNITKFIGPNMEVNFKYYDVLVGDYSFDIKLTNPTKFVAFDVRAIVVPDPWAPISFINPDDYTTQFDWIAPENVNGFRAFFKSAHQRAFNPGTSNTQTFIMNCPIQYAKPSEWDILITCSSPGNTTDPYEINPQHMQFPVDPYFWSEVRVQVLDWQDDVEHVYVDTTIINGGVMELQREGTSNMWRGLLKNMTGAPAGIYTCRITADSTAWDSHHPDPDECTYDFIQIEVK